MISTPTPTLVHKACSSNTLQLWAGRGGGEDTFGRLKEIINTSFAYSFTMAQN